MTRQSLVDRVVDDLENHVVEPGSVIGVTDVHARAFPDGVETLQDLDFAGVVDVFVGHARPLPEQAEIIAFKGLARAFPDRPDTRFRPVHRAAAVWPDGRSGCAWVLAHRPDAAKISTD